MASVHLSPSIGEANLFQDKSRRNNFQNGSYVNVEVRSTIDTKVISQKMQDDGFHLVQSKRKSRIISHPGRYSSSSCMHCLGRTCTDLDEATADGEKLNEEIITKSSQIDLDKVIDSVQRCQQELRSSELYKSVSATLLQSLTRFDREEDVEIKVEFCELTSLSPPPVRFTTLICYGLGNFSSCIIARYQLALFLCLMEDMKGEGLLFDPAFSTEEATILTRLQCAVIGSNEEGKRSVESPTLFYMPHCAKELYNNLLWANWSPSLSKLVILGNSFSHMMDNLPYRQFQNNWNYISKAVPLVEEFGIKNCFRYNDIFNDTAVHIFSKSKISRLQQNFWQQHDEPVYQDST